MTRKPRRAPSTTDRFFNPRSIAALSIKDLLEARDAHHVHLANLPNVVGTALGISTVFWAVARAGKKTASRMAQTSEGRLFSGSGPVER